MSHVVLVIVAFLMAESWRVAGIRGVREILIPYFFFLKLTLIKSKPQPPHFVQPKKRGEKIIFNRLVE
ncbi:hypothetical protein [Rhodobacter capsulatus]|uniref:hypothetical protein n=1 Tax=Rhodobacter capsulatus TaxID=1061 RepID=UPI00146A4C57|nr:hypothetical protein [Rhodobacter capsulatus]